MQRPGYSSSYLPVELWRKVLRYATEEGGSSDDDRLFHPVHRNVLRTKLAVVQVCRHWKDIAIEFLWEYVGNRNQEQLVNLAFLLQKKPRGNGVARGWWIRSLHTRFDFGDSLDVFISTIVSILKFCPNLGTFMHIHDFNGPLPTRVVTALADHCGHTLRRFQLDWGGVNIDDLILLLETSPALQHLGVGCTFAPPSSPSISAHQFRFHQLRSLHFGNSEDGMTRRFNCHLLEAATWIMPALTTVSIDLDARTSVEELIGFLQVHGPKLDSLSLTDSGRVDGLPITWNDIFTFCPKLVELRLSYNPFLHNGQAEDDADLPQLITSPLAMHLKRLCFAQWEFFYEREYEISSSGTADTSYRSSPLPILQNILDRQFASIGGEFTPALESIQFDFHAGCLNLPEASLDWWNGWLRIWREKGLVVEGCNREVL